MSDLPKSVLLTPDEMTQADQAAIADGVPGVVLMEEAGKAVAAAICERWRPCPVLVLCGPGNNGGDGFVVAQRLQAAGWPVSVVLLGGMEALQGDAAWHAQQWQGEVLPLAGPATRPIAALLRDSGLVVDALFGAGLSRDIDGKAAALLKAIAARRIPVCAIDMPSGVDGASGAVRGTAVAATLTVTFFRKKPGHVLLPGRDLCGELQVADIGIRNDVPGLPMTTVFENTPELWMSRIPWPQAAAHKYQRGHVLVNGGARMTGAARLAALAAARSGAGLVTIAAPAEAWPVYAAAMTSVMVEPLPDGELAPALADERRKVFVVGPGAGLGELTRRNVLAAAATGRPLVLDADALSEFGNDSDTLFQALRGPCVLTPHDGEFSRLFPDIDEPNKLERARRSARQSGAVMILKGADTVVAEPGGRAVINTNAPVWLATGGTGDVLAGLVAGLLAQDMPVFEAACAAVWMHGEAGRLAGPGLISEDLPGLLPQVLRQLYEA